jgi:hypothetical protein
MTSTLTGSSDRRGVLAALSLLPLAALGACATLDGRYTLDEGVRRLLALSSQRAFARLTAPGGFYDDQLTRIAVPRLDSSRGGAVLPAILRTNAVRDRIATALNDVAVDMADNAAPVLLDAVHSMTFSDALSILRGGPTAATDLLERETRGRAIEAILPGTARALHSDLFEVLSAALAASGGGVDYAALADDVSGQIGAAIFRAIGREEAEIRRDPRATHDPALIALLG